jgi:hypothetical protein
MAEGGNSGARKDSINMCPRQLIRKQQYKNCGNDVFYAVHAEAI